MLNIRKIMEIVACDQATAFLIFNEMAGSGLDFSECTKAEFKRAAIEAARIVKARVAR